MGYWQCPRCGSHEVFQGTEVVAGGGISSVGITNEHGFSMSRNTGLRTKQVEVTKCKACGEILNAERNYHYSTEDLAQIKAKKLKEKPYRYVLAAVSIFFALLFVGGVLNIRNANPWAAAILLPMCAYIAWSCRPWKEDLWEPKQ